MPATAADLRRQLRDHVRSSARNAPGIYQMLGGRGEVLYIGKSTRVRTRLLSYFRAKDDEKAQRILRDAHAIEWSYEPSEFAALLRELQLIKTYRPRFNVQHKRDGRYSFLKLIPGAAPKLLVVTSVADDTASYFGPFRGGRRILEAVRELNDTLGLRDCPISTPIAYADQPDLFAFERTPRCHRHSVRRCAGPCAGLCSEAEYLALVALARAFLDGDADEPLLWLERRMLQAADALQFEYAAMLRNRMQRLEMLQTEFGRLREALDRLSFLYAVKGFEGDDRIYLIRRGTVREVIARPRSKSARAHLIRRVEHHYGHPEPDVALVTKHQVDEILLLERWFRLRPEELARTVPHTDPARLRFGRA